MTEATDNRRQYAMTMVGPGDWLFPSNDATTIWRVARYTDASDPGAKWQTHRMPIEQFRRILDNAWEDPTDWAHWHYYAGGFRTRREAVDDAVRA